MGDYIDLEQWRKLLEFREEIAAGGYALLNEYGKKCSEQRFKALAKQQPMTQEQFSQQYERVMKCRPNTKS